MASLDSLPADQRAVLQLVLQRGRSYDDIAQLLSIDRAAVRERALAALDALGPGTRVPPEQRAVITDYLLGQLPERIADDTHNRLADSAGERAWARVVASELGTMVTGSLPEIPVEGAPGRGPASGEEPPAGQDEYDEPAPEEVRARDHAPVGAVPPPTSHERDPGDTQDAGHPPPPPSGRRPRPTAGGDGGGEPPASRRDGAILLGGGALLLVAIVIAVILITGGSSSKSSSSTSTAASVSTTATTSAAQTSTTGTATGTAKPIAQVNLTPPTAGSKAKGAAVIVRQGTTTAIEIVGTGVPPNISHDAYAVWLYNSPSDNRLLGFVNPGIKSNGVLRTLGPLPTNASHFKQLLVTRETQAKPRGPGTVILQGALSLPAGA